MAEQNASTISPEFLEILRCPVAVHYKDKGSDPGRLRLVRDGYWLVCDDSGYKYPIVEGIPRMLVEIGEKYKDVAEADLPVPPPAGGLTEQPITMPGRSRQVWVNVLAQTIALSVVIVMLTACGAVTEQVIPTLRPTHTPTLAPSATFTRVFNATPTITPTPVQVVAASTSGPTVTPLIGEVPTRPRYTLTPTELFVDPGALRIEYFTTSTTALKPGDRLTLFWSIKGVEKAVIYRLDPGGKREQLWNVGRAGSLEVETRPTDRDTVQFLLYAGDDKSHVEQTIAIPLKCTEPWFFEPAPDGCPASPATITAEVQQPFERGLMIWVQSQSRIYVLFNDNQKPAWTFFPDEFKDGQPESDPALSPPAGMLQPIRGFGLVWRAHGAVKQRLGWATARETPFDGAFQGDAETDSVMYLRDKDGTILALSDKGASWKLIKP